MLEQEKIKPVKGLTPWVSPKVPVPKPDRPNEIPICRDAREANKVIIRKRRSCPTVEDLAHLEAEKEAETEVEVGEWSESSLEGNNETKEENKDCMMDVVFNSESTQSATSTKSDSPTKTTHSDASTESTQPKSSICKNKNTKQNRNLLQEVRNLV
ncbi:unnamed protein product [Brachionus calyciflorus]|uniref:Uncharacterized protein n=1 Tax=Brachionus calyciflorus TaxID=104777 RepID=A0A813S0R8_9BILA|nr:unnamed protein product [Brachionus calyciflorus]